jgi:hypothetical protein
MPELGATDGTAKDWCYFGLIKDKNGICVLDETSFACPDGRDSLWDATTEIEIDQIRAKGKSFIEDMA